METFYLAIACFLLLTMIAGLSRVLVGPGKESVDAGGHPMGGGFSGDAGPHQRRHRRVPL